MRPAKVCGLDLSEVCYCHSRPEVHSPQARPFSGCCVHGHGLLPLGGFPWVKSCRHRTVHASPLFCSQTSWSTSAYSHFAIDWGKRPPHTSLSLIFFYLTSFNLQVDRVQEGSRLAGQLPSPGLIWARACEGCLRIWWSPPPSPHIFFDSWRGISIATCNGLSISRQRIAMRAAPPRIL